MPDRKMFSDPQDYTHIRIGEAYEARYWAARFNVTEAELTALVGAHGDAVASVIRAIDAKKTDAEH